MGFNGEGAARSACGTNTGSGGTSPIVTTPKSHSLFRGILLGATAACGAVTISNPFEVVKTRLQLQGELTKLGGEKRYKNVLSGLWLIFKNEGLRGIQRGLLSAYIYQSVLNGCRLGLYEPLKALIDPSARKQYPRPPPNPVVNVSAGILAGLAGAFLSSPLFLVKTRLQSFTPEKAMVVGHQHRYTGAWHAITDIYKKEGGVKALFRGANACLLRTGTGSGVQLATYDRIKHLLRELHFEDGLLAHLVSAFGTGLCLVTAMNPFDVVTVRMYNQKTDPITRKGSLYSGPLDCMSKIAKTEGPLGFYKGFTAHWLRVGPHTIGTFVFLEQLRKLADKHWK